MDDVADEECEITMRNNSMVAAGGCEIMVRNNFK